jgi:hypothetical protein
LVTELARKLAGDQDIMDIAGHVSRQTLVRYSHIRMDAGRKPWKPSRISQHPRQRPSQPTDEKQAAEVAPQTVH